MKMLFAAPRTKFLLTASANAAVLAVLAFYFLERSNLATLDLEMSLEIPGPSKAQLFFDRGSGRMQEQDSVLADVQPGRSGYSLDIPLDIKALRLDPLICPGKVEIQRMTFTTLGIPIHGWDSNRGFDGWQPLNQVEGFSIANGILSFRSLGGDPSVEIKSLPDLREMRESIHYYLACLAGLLIGIVHTLIMRWALGTAEVRHQTPEPRGMETGLPGRSSMRMAGPLLFLVSAALCASLGYLVYQRIIIPRMRPAAPVQSNDYEQLLVDRAGQPFSDKPGDLQLVVDPYALYRNYPNQKRRRFSIDARGYRTSTGSDDSRPLAVVLGGSLAFGFGLPSDADTVQSRLNTLNTGFSFVNAAVVGYLSGQELSEMVHYAERLHPALYIALDGWNEIYVQLFTNLAVEEYGYNWHELTALEDRLRMNRESRLRAGTGLSSGRPAPDPSTVQRNILAAYTRNLEKMAAFARARDAAFFVAFQPQLGNKRHLTEAEERHREEWLAAYKATHGHFAEQYDALVAQARVFCDQKVIRYVDLHGSDRIRNSSDELFLDTVHLNSAGHRIAAELLAGAIGEFARTNRKP